MFFKQHCVLTVLATSFMIGMCNFACADAPEIVIATPGGIVKDAETSVYAKALTAETGIKVKNVVLGDDALEQVRAMVRAKKVIWDEFEIPSVALPALEKEGLLEPLDYSVIDPKHVLPEYAKLNSAVVISVWGTVLAERTDKLPQGKEMKNWADFWDTKTFPGPRGLRKSAPETLEFALLADGVPKSDLYKVLGTKEGVDRAFRKLDQIRPSIGGWWANGAESVQLMADGQVWYCPMFNGRIQKLTDAGIPVKLVWEGGAGHLTAHGIPKGSKNVAAAYQSLMRRATRPDLAREYVRIAPYPITTPAAFESLPESIKAVLPTTPPHPDQMFRSSEDFWQSTAGIAIKERFNEWLLQ